MNRRIAFLLGLLFELIAIFGLFIPYEMLRANGTPVTLRTVPMDPRSILRGDYVILGYEAGEGLPLSDKYGSPIYAVLEKKGDVYERVRFSEEKPTLETGQLCLRGRIDYQRAVFPDIAQYYVEEGMGHELENARNMHRLFVDAVVDKNCRAALLGLRIGPEVPDKDLPEWMKQNMRLEQQVPPDVKPLPASAPGA